MYDPVGGIESIGVLEGGFWSEANAINQLGDVAGTSGAASGQFAVVYSDGILTSLGVLPDATAGSSALGINSSGEVVGISYGTSGPNRAFVWSEGQMWDLSQLITTPGILMYEATGINEHGDIVGTAIVDGRSRAVMLVKQQGSPPTPGVVPEPSTIVMAGLGAVALVGLAWRRRAVASVRGH